MTPQIESVEEVARARVAERAQKRVRELEAALEAQRKQVLVELLGDEVVKAAAEWLGGNRGWARKLLTDVRATLAEVEPEVEPVAEEPSAITLSRPVALRFLRHQDTLDDRKLLKGALVAAYAWASATTCDPAAKCTCGHTAHWHGQEIGDPEGTGECEFRIDCGCKKFSLDHTKTDERSSKEGDRG